MLVFGQSIKQVGILVTKASPEMKLSKDDYSGILGMNVLSNISKLSTIFSKSGVNVMRQGVKLNDKINFVKVSSCVPVQVPSRSVVDVKVQCAGKGMVLVEPLHGALPGNLLVGTSLLDLSSEIQYIQVINSSNEDIWLKPGTRLARVQVIDEICSGAGEIDVTVSCNGITVEKNNTLELGDKNPELPDLSTLQYDKSQKDKIEKLLQRHKEVFVSERSPLGCTDTVRHHIRTTDDIPISQPYRRIPPQLFEEVRNHLNDLLKKGVIQESESAYAAPIVLVRKKTGELRICNDYRKLNKKVVRDAFPLPRIEESLEAMAGAKIFSALDLASVYNQIQVEPADRPKTAITTPFGLFEAVRMPFGLANAPATFQRLVVKIFREDIFRVLLVYLDDLIIYSGSFEEHLETLNMVFSKLKEHELVLKGPKCQLFKKDVKYLGHVLSCDGVRTDPDKIIAVEKWCKPGDAPGIAEVHRFHFLL